MTATEVSRNFAAVLDAVEHGETIVVTRGNRRIARFDPEPEANGKAFKEFMSAWQGKLDDDWEADIRSGLEYLDEEIRNPWDD
jgi:antitoxin (DNA-binding transcriptional repressor) of toxin-antitoxin stability system